MKITPGRWHLPFYHERGSAEPIGILSDHRYGADDPEQICLVGGDLMSPQDALENDANAHLIAAAPDLYHACLAALDFMEEAARLKRFHGRAEIDQVRQALRLAEGRLEWQ